MQIEAGKYYRTRDGRKVGPFTLRRWTDGFPWDEDTEDKYFWSDGGECQVRGNGENDLIAEWSEGPVRTETVTKRRIVPGVYGRLRVGGVANGRVAVLFDSIGACQGLDATELDELAMVASQLAEALRDA